MSGVTLKLKNSEYQDVPEGIATGVLTEFNQLNNEITNLKQRLDEKDKTFLSNQDMESYELDGKTYKDMGSMYKDMCGYKKDMEKYKKMYEDMKGKKDTADAKNDVLKSQVDKMNTDSSDQSIMLKVQSRRKLERTAQNHLKDFSIERFDSMNNLEIKQAIIKENGFDPAQYNEDQLDAMIGVIEANNKNRQDSYQKQVQAFNTTNIDRKDDNIWAWCDQRVEDVENAWKQPLVQGGSN